MHAAGEGGSPPCCGCAVPTALQTEPGTCLSPAATAACVPRPLYKVLAGTQCCLGPSVPARALQESTGRAPGDCQPQATCPLPRSASSCPLSSFPWLGAWCWQCPRRWEDAVPLQSCHWGCPAHPDMVGLQGPCLALSPKHPPPAVPKGSAGTHVFATAPLCPHLVAPSFPSQREATPNWGDASSGCGRQLGACFRKVPQGGALGW